MGKAEEPRGPFCAMWSRPDVDQLRPLTPGRTCWADAATCCLQVTALDAAAASVLCDHASSSSSSTKQRAHDHMLQVHHTAMD